MAVTIAFRPKDNRGEQILDRLQKRHEMQPAVIANDGTRRYYLEDDANVDALDPMLEEIDRDWRGHLTNWRDG